MPIPSAQKIYFSINLAKDGGVHTNNSTTIVKDQNFAFHNCTALKSKAYATDLMCSRLQK